MTAMTAERKQDLEFDCTIPNFELVPPGHYEVVFEEAERARAFSSRIKIFLHFRISQQGSHLNKRLFMSANFPDGGRLPLSSKFLKMWILANHGKQPARQDRLSTKIFRNKTFLANVKTVETDFRGNDRPEDERYSVIDTLLKVLTGQ